MATPFHTSRPPLRSKFSQCYAALLSGQQPWTQADASTSSTDAAAAASADGHAAPRPDLSRTKSKGKTNSGPQIRYFADLLCLPVETRLVVELLGAVSADALLDDDPASRGALIRDNVGSLWREAIRVWRQRDEDDVRRRNAVDTLVALSYPILAKRFSNYAFDIIAIFAGGMDEADDVFISLVDAIDDALRSHRPRRTVLASGVRDESADDHDAHGAAAASEAAYLDRDLQHRALQLGLLWLSCVSQTSLGAYFLRRDLFVTVTAFVRAPSTSIFAFESSLFLGLLATVGQGSSSSLMLSSSTSNPYARRMRDWVDYECMAKILFAAAAALEQATQQYVELADDTVPTLAGSLAGMASLRWIGGLGEIVGMTTSASSTSIASDINGRRRPSATGGPDFAHLPSPSTVILLPVFLLARSNQAFASKVVFATGCPTNADDVAQTQDDDGATGCSYVQLLSLSSYLCTHAAGTPRSRSYARVALLLLLVLLHDPSGIRAVLDDSDRSTRLREPGLSYPRQKPRRLVTCNIVVATCHLRHNLSKRLDIHSHLLGLRIIQRSITLCAAERISLEFDWADTWNAIFSLAAFVAGRHAEIRAGAELPQLVRSIVATLNTALLRSDHFLASTKETQAFLYELVRSSHVIRTLACILDPAVVPASPREGSATLLEATPTPPKLYALLPGYRNLEHVILAVEARISDWVAAKPSSRRNKTPDIVTVSKIVSNLNLEDLLAGGDDEASEGATANVVRARDNADLEWLDKMQESSLAEFVRWSCADVMRILPIY
ncbi:uncharacterized protein PFL1_05082 [Pseudozyma flocculosa PF-1]|uniref:Armadillo-like helical domain-containing protein n=1 Tax=Pseudozyma flocculosa PF-1 TaxID=1277687 RepID=A0A061H539_9BASI|nr:uncharacterized protein PFL1_05082 [Pseudozyma flocculosa PF-1]EPQ27544.1 hypothetical protein PFL1_05082 [Pseudozyma flocculosa PF-1]